jgi:hypothetical protein
MFLMNRRFVVWWLSFGIIICLVGLLLVLFFVFGEVRRGDLFEGSVWDSENRFADIFIDGKLSEGAVGFDLVFVFADGEIVYYAEKKEGLIEFRCLDFGNASGELMFIKLIPVFVDGVRGDVISEISADKIKKSDLVNEGQCERRTGVSSSGGAVGGGAGGGLAGGGGLSLGGGSSTGGGSGGSGEGRRWGSGSGGVKLPPCNPVRSCSYYYSIGQCGYNLYDGCTNSLNCVQCSENNYCYIGQGISNICLDNNMKCEDSGGINNYIKGFVKINQTTTNDYCIENNTIKHYCYYNGNDFEIRNYSFQCNYGCNDGACVMPPYEASGVLELSRTGGYASLTNNDFDDLDYTKDFSVEVIGRIEEFQRGGRYGTFVQKGASTVLWNQAYPGFAIGTDTGNEDTYAKSIICRIGDGNSVSSVTSWREGYSYQGDVYIIMTWNVSAKKMNCYTNGLLIGNRTNQDIVPGNMKNNDSFGISTSHNDLRRDVFSARIWQKELSKEEVGQLYENYNLKGQHSTPLDFNRDYLISEWLMTKTSDRNGNLGATHIRDTTGNNHLELKGGAEIITQKNNLQLVYPINNSFEVSKSVELKVIGGELNLNNPALPLHYYFQIDETPKFNSKNLKESGWIAHYGKWKPVLKPDTKYYWRVKAKDSSYESQETPYSETYEFSTKGLLKWYVRNLVDIDGSKDSLGNPIEDRGVYGIQDGTSYENAFNGLANIKWGEGGVEAGDTLYICGIHIFNSYNSYWDYPVNGRVRESGFSDEYPLIITTNCPEEPGVILGGANRNMNSEVVWEGPDENNVYWTSDFSRAAFIELDGKDYTALRRENKTTWKGNYGYAFMIDGVNYVKTSDGASPNGKIIYPEASASHFGFRIDIGRNDHIKFKDFKMFGATVSKNSQRSTRSELEVSKNITFENCDMGHVGATIIGLGQGMDNWVIRNCNLHDAENGIYTGTPGHVYNLLIENNRIYDIGMPFTHYYHPDQHAIGIQNGANHIIQNNTIYHIGGTAIEFWACGYTMKNMTVRNNFISDVYASHSQTGGGGITVSGCNYDESGRRTGFKIYNNVVMNTGINKNEGWKGNGIGGTQKDSLIIANNLVINVPRRGIGSVVMDAPSQAKIFNNIIIDIGESEYSGWSYINIHGTNEGDWSNFLCDNNLLYNMSKEFPIVFSSRIEQNNQGNNFIIGEDPLFVDFENHDFRLRPDSPAIDAGVLIPGIHCETSGAHPGKDCVEWYGSAPDIGAYEYIPEGTVQSTQSYSLFSRITNVLTGKVISNKITEKFMFLKITSMLFLVFLTLFIIRKIKLKKDI